MNPTLTEADHIINRVAHWILAECRRAKQDWTKLTKDDPLVAQGAALAIAEAEARGVPVAQVATDAHDLLATVQDVAAETDTPPVGKA